MSLPLLLGECPSKAGDRYHDFPLSGAVGRTLCQFAGIDPEPEGSRFGRFYWALRERFDAANAIERWTEKWDGNVARARVSRLLADRRNGSGPRTVVCLGRRAAAAVGLPPNAPWGGWYLLDGNVRAVVIPHPSGRNLVLNDPEMRELAGRVLHQAMD